MCPWVQLPPHHCRMFPLLLTQMGFGASAACECVAEDQTTDHVVLQCPIHPNFPWTVRRAVVSGSRPPHLKSVLPFHVWPPGCCIHPIQYFKNVSPLPVFGPSFWFLPPLLLNPGNGPDCTGWWFWMISRGVTNGRQWGELPLPLAS